MSVSESFIKGYNMLSPFSDAANSHKVVQHAVTLFAAPTRTIKGITPVYTLSVDKGYQLLRINLPKGYQSCCHPFTHYYRDRDTYISLFRSSQSYVVPERLLQLRESCSFSEHAASTFSLLSQQQRTTVGAPAAGRRDGTSEGSGWELPHAVPSPAVVGSR